MAWRTARHATPPLDDPAQAGTRGVSGRRRPRLPAARRLLAEFVIDDVDEQRLALLRLLERPRELDELRTLSIPEHDLRGKLAVERDVGCPQCGPATHANVNCAG